VPWFQFLGEPEEEGSRDVRWSTGSDGGVAGGGDARGETARGVTDFSSM